jgi:hypothetical protein
MKEVGQVVFFVSVFQITDLGETNSIKRRFFLGFPYFALFWQPGEGHRPMKVILHVPATWSRLFGKQTAQIKLELLPVWGKREHSKTTLF